MTSLNWGNLRPWNGLQHLAFEEICCQLANCETVPDGSLFIRKGTPDAGVECFWKLPNKKEYCWQAKYFLSSPDSNQWSQIDKSVQKALEKHPNMTKYTVCLPIDRPDGRDGKSKSCLDKWDEHVARWEGWASGECRTVEFAYWGKSEIFQCLSQEEHRGRCLFWFDKDMLSYQKMLNQIDETIANVGPRYTPELNIHLELSEAFDFIARTEKYTFELRKNIGFFHRKLQSLVTKECPDTLRNNINKIRLFSVELIAKLSRLANSAIEIADLENLSQLLNTLRDLYWDSEGIIHEAKSEEYVAKTNKKPEDMPHYYASEKYDRWLYNIGEVRKAIDNLYVFIESNNAQLAMNPAMLLSGAAGSGKTHLLCDLAKERLTQKLPTVFLLGQNFCEEEPWGQIIRQLQLNCQTKEELLGILDAAGQAARTRTLILIDAINESACKEMWKNHLAGILEAVKRYPWVGIVLSIRSTYFKYMIPQQLIEKRKLIAVPHKGFAGIEYKATREFFRYYNIKQPDVPLLNPEFQNPLFLKLFCCGLNNVGITEVPRGSQNITKVYENFIESVNDKLADENVLNYDLRDKIVWKAVEGLAGKMAERNDNRIPLAEAKDIVYKILPSNGYHNSLFHHLETEGIITESIIYTKDICEEAVQFSYERFADHLIAKYLLDKHLNVDAPQSSFKKGQPLASLFTQEFYWHYEGLIEAISIQLPERIDKELIELVPKYAKRNSIQQAFLDSLIWRDLKSISKKTKDIINKYIIQNNYDQLMETFITIATLIDHPFNADALHQYLLKQDLPNRDATWSIFLFYQAGENGAIDRLIDWAWSSGDKSHIDDSSILLAAKTLTWFLTTSQRYLRDRATKAMVNLLTERIELLPILIEDFKNADDPYIHERLYAVAYGCAMRTNDKDKIRDLADYIYENVFKDGTPPVHVLLRDYARGVIELALYYGLKTNACLKKIRPPYKSTWPDDIPSKDELENLYSYDAKKKGVKADKHWRILYHHIANSCFSDFNRYIIEYGCYGWSSRKRGEPKKITNEGRYSSFVDFLTSKQKRAWDKLCEYRSLSVRIILSIIDNEQISEIKPKLDAEKQLEEAENKFIKTLGKKKTSQYYGLIIPYINGEIPKNGNDRFDKSIAESFIFKRVLDLGWDPKLHAKFDEKRHDMGRRANKSERISKKYQWIAYHELLALMCDNFEYREDSFSGEKRFEGPWQSCIRDIDPSFILKRVVRDSWTSDHSSTWWFPLTYESWDYEVDDVTWMQKTEDLPDCKQIIEVRKPDNSCWLNLAGFYKSLEPIPPEEETYEKARREIWFMVKSYLVKKENSDELFAWAKEQDFFGRWMPESSSNTRIFLGEFYWSPAFKFHEQPYYCHDGWTKNVRGKQKLPTEILITNDEYLHESGCYDCSIDNTISIDIPAKEIVNKMELSWNGCEGEWYNKNGDLVAFDPSTRTAGSGALLINKEVFIKSLNEQGHDVLWTILGEKQLIGGRMSGNSWKGRLIINGVARIEEGEIVTHMSQYYQFP